MIVVALQRSGFDPSFAVGGDLGQPGTNAHHGSGTTFVAEADESDGSLLEYSPDVAVVTNVEADHLDFFGTEAAYAAVFDEFVKKLRPGWSAGRLRGRRGCGRTGRPRGRRRCSGPALRQWR